MAKVIKLKDRQGSLVLPLTRSQLVQVSQISGLDLLDSKNWNKASVQDALEALYSYASTISNSNATALSDIATIKNALKDVLDNQRAVADYADNVKVLAYAEAASKATEAKDLAYNYVDAREAAIKTAYEAADTTIISNYEAADTALGSRINDVVTAYEAADATIISNYEAADTALNARIDALDASYTVETGKVFTQIDQVDGKITNVQTAYLTAADIKRTATVNDESAGTKALAATDVEAALQELARAVETGGTGSVVTLEEASTPDNGFLKTYVIKQGGSAVGGGASGKINIPKDFLIKSGTVETVETANTPYSGAVVGDKYLDFVVNTVGNDETETHMYIPVKDLTDVYTGGVYTLGQTSTEVVVADDNTIYSYLTSVDASIVKTDASTTLPSYLHGIQTTLEEHTTTLGSHQSDLTAYNTRIEALETAAQNLSYNVTDDSAYITVTPSTSSGATTFTISTSDIASDTNLQALQTSYNNMNTELSNSGVFYEQVGENTIADTTLDSFTI